MAAVKEVVPSIPRTFYNRAVAEANLVMTHPGKLPPRRWLEPIVDVTEHAVMIHEGTLPKDKAPPLLPRYATLPRAVPPRSVPPPLRPVHIEAARASALKAALAYLKGITRDAALAAYHAVFPTARGLPVLLKDVKANLAELPVAADRKILREAIASEGLTPLQQGFRVWLNTVRPTTPQNTVEKLLAQSKELHVQGHHLQALMRRGPAHEVSKSVIATANDRVAEVMRTLAFDGTEKSLMPLVHSLAELQEAVDVAKREELPTHGRTLINIYQRTLREVRAHTRDLLSDTQTTQVLEAHQALRLAGTKLYPVLATKHIAKLGGAQAEVADAVKQFRSNGQIEAMQAATLRVASELGAIQESASFSPASRLLWAQYAATTLQMNVSLSALARARELGATANATKS
jgi:hypothetical protein